MGTWGKFVNSIQGCEFANAELKNGAKDNFLEGGLRQVFLPVAAGGRVERFSPTLVRSSDLGHFLGCRLSRWLGFSIASRSVL